MRWLASSLNVGIKVHRHELLPSGDQHLSMYMLSDNISSTVLTNSLVAATSTRLNSPWGRSHINLGWSHSFYMITNYFLIKRPLGLFICKYELEFYFYAEICHLNRKCSFCDSVTAELKARCHFYILPKKKDGGYDRVQTDLASFSSYILSYLCRTEHGNRCRTEFFVRLSLIGLRRCDLQTDGIWTLYGRFLVFVWR